MPARPPAGRGGRAVRPALRRRAGTRTTTSTAPTATGCAAVDRPIAGLIADLKRRGLLDETLIVWCGEFGRIARQRRPRRGTAYGRDHNATAMTIWLAGGGRQGRPHRSAPPTRIGAEAVEVVHPVRDLHVTLLRLLGLDDNKLTYFHAGRFKQLSQFGGEVINELIA